MQRGHLRLPALHSPDTVGLNAAGQTNIIIEEEIHNLSDADFVFSIPAITESQVILASLAAHYGYDPANTTVYNTKFRNPVLSFLSGERILVLYTTKGHRGGAGTDRCAQGARGDLRDRVTS